MNAKDLSTRCLADRLGDLIELVNLFPNINKSSAFDRYKTPASRASPGYLPSELKMIVNVPGTSSSGGQLGHYTQELCLNNALQ